MEHSLEGISKNIKHQETRLLKQQTKKGSTRMGFEPTRAEHIGLAVQRLNHSATSSIGNFERNRSSFVILLWRPLSVSWYSFDLISNQLFQIGKEEKIYRNSSNKAKVHDIFGSKPSLPTTLMRRERKKILRTWENWMYFCVRHFPVWPRPLFCWYP